MENKSKKRRLTPTVAMHYLKLSLRLVIFLCAAGIYVYNRINSTGKPFAGFENYNAYIIGAIWVFFVIGMVLRLFPSKIESMGCQKQFKRNYKEKPDAPKERSEMNRQPGVITFAAFSAWIALNAIIGMLYYMGIFDKGILLLIALAYSVCDVICILFFCPFQTWIMKNKCCGSCRIYNWDYAMMFTPFIFIPHPFTWSLLGIALIILFKWEITYRLHPERYVESCNDSISCKNCTEKLCQHKKQLRRFLKKRAFKFNLKENPIFKKKKDKKDNESSND
jgi:hypothetical protein